MHLFETYRSSQYRMFQERSKTNECHSISTPSSVSLSLGFYKTGTPLINEWGFMEILHTDMQSAAPLFEILNGMTFEEFYGFGG